MSSRTYTAAYLNETIADEACFPTEQLRVYPFGLRLSTAWRLTAGTELELGVSCGDCCRSIRAIVVECQPREPLSDRFEVTIFFTEEPCCEFQHIIDAFTPRSSGLEGDLRFGE
ncbi:MAG: hypothetical protein AAGK14_08500 [Verrucomicrobiota bacterium]